MNKIKKAIREAIAQKDNEAINIVRKLLKSGYELANQDYYKVGRIRVLLSISFDEDDDRTESEATRDAKKILLSSGFKQETSSTFIKGKIKVTFAAGNISIYGASGDGIDLPTHMTWDPSIAEKAGGTKAPTDVHPFDMGDR